MNKRRTQNLADWKMPVIFGVLALSTWLACMQLAIAHEGATGIVKQRMDAMKEIGDHAKEVGGMFKGRHALNPSTIREAADAFVAHGREIPELFPDTASSRDGHKTEALPAIWEDWTTFNSLAIRFTDDSRKLVELAAALDDDLSLKDTAVQSARKAFLNAVESCSDCHRRFRVKRKG